MSKIFNFHASFDDRKKKRIKALDNEIDDGQYDEFITAMNLNLEKDDFALAGIIVDRRSEEDPFEVSSANGFVNIFPEYDSASVDDINDWNLFLKDGEVNVETKKVVDAIIRAMIDNGIDLEDGEGEDIELTFKAEDVYNQDLWLYLFPELDQKDIEIAGRYGVEYKGINEFASETNYVFQGTEEGLKDFADAIGYELHEGYLYEPGNFAGEIKAMDSGKFTVIYNYFDRKGDQHQREISRATLPALITAMKRALSKDELYYIARVSPNLFDYDFDQHGEEFKGYASMRANDNQGSVLVVLQNMNEEGNFLQVYESGYNKDGSRKHGFAIVTDPNKATVGREHFLEKIMLKEASQEIVDNFVEHFSDVPVYKEFRNNRFMNVEDARKEYESLHGKKATDDNTLYTSVVADWNADEDIEPGVGYKDEIMANLKKSGLDHWNLDGEEFAEGTKDQWAEYFRLSTWMDGLIPEWTNNGQGMLEEMLANEALFANDEAYVPNYPNGVTVGDHIAVIEKPFTDSELKKLTSHGVKYHGYQDFGDGVPVEVIEGYEDDMDALLESMGRPATGKNDIFYSEDFEFGKIVPKDEVDLKKKLIKNAADKLMAAHDAVGDIIRELAYDRETKEFLNNLTSVLLGAVSEIKSAD